MTVVEKFESVETCTEYEVAVAVIFQESVGVVIMSTAPLDGEERTGAPITAVVNLQTDDHALVPPVLFPAFTRQ